MVLARGQQGSKLFDNLSAFRPRFFTNTLPILMGISGFSMRVAPTCIILFLISAPPPHFLLFFLRPGRLKGQIWYISNYNVVQKGGLADWEFIF